MVPSMLATILYLGCNFGRVVDFFLRSAFALQSKLLQTVDKLEIASQ